MKALVYGGVGSRSWKDVPHPSIKDVTITTGLVDTRIPPLLLRLLSEGALDVSQAGTHRFGLDEMQDAYDVFSRASETGTLKVALFSPEGAR